MSTNPETVLLIGISLTNESMPLGNLQFITNRLQKFLPKLFPLDLDNIHCMEYAPNQAKSSDFLAKIPLEIMQQVTIPVFVIVEWDKNKRRRIQEEYFQKYDEWLTQYAPQLPLLILVHKPGERVLKGGVVGHIV